MPNKKGGKKFKRTKKVITDKKLIYKDSKLGEEYGKILKTLGNGRFEIECFDGKNRIGIVAGKLRKRIWINLHDIVIITLWEFSSNGDKCSIIHKYDSDEISKLINENEISSNLVNDTHDNDTLDDDIIFDYSINSDEEKDEIIDDNSDDSEVDINDI